jgi:hypothetical protein
MKKALLCVIAAGVLGGCASADTASTPPAEREEAVYRTGSNIPTRQKAGSGDGVSVYGQEALDRARSETAGVPRAGIPGSKPGN